MKEFRFSLLLVVVYCLTCLHSCELFSDFNDDCDATKMIEVREPVIYLRAVLPPGRMNISSDLTWKLAEATHIQISGSIQKVYCNGNKSGYYEFSHNIYPVDYSITELESGLFLAQPYQYKFQNDLDKVLVIVTYKAWFSDGAIFESHTFTDDYFFKDIQYEVNQIKYYIKLDQLLGESQWRRVYS